MLSHKDLDLGSNDVLERLVVLDDSSPLRLDFKVPTELEAKLPPEARGLARDEVRLMVSNYRSNRIEHAEFRDFQDYLDTGDVVVINTSGTMKAAVIGQRDDGSRLEVHFSTHLPGDLWTVELRVPAEVGTEPFYGARPGEKLLLPEKSELHILAPYQVSPRPRLWLARIYLDEPLVKYLERHGFPIRYSYVPEAWPSECYQTAYATEVGSAEMPSAGRGFTAEMIMRLVMKGVQVTPLILHTGVSSQESHEPPYEEYFRIPETTAQIVNLAREMGKRVVAVGTTSVRALETATDSQGVTHPSQGWTNLVITPGDQIRSVNCLLTGMHESEASHLGMLAALAGVRHVELCYQEALRKGYLWHEFGDLHLIVR